MKKILTVGSAMLDLFLSLGKDTLPCIEKKESRQSFMLLEVGRKLELPTIHRCSGGGATNAAVSLSRQGFEVSAFFKAGVDCESEFIKRQLAQDNIDTHNCVSSKNAPTGISLIFPCSDGDRTTLTYRGASITLSEQELPLSLLKNLDCLYITSLTGATAPLLLPLVKAAHKQNIFIASNPGSSQLRAGAYELQLALPYIDVLILNSDEAVECMKSFIATGISLKEPKYVPGPALVSMPFIREDITFNLRQYCAEVLSRGPKMVVITNGKEGVYVAHGTTLLFHPSLPAEVVNTLGAGDAFGSGFVGALLHHKSIEEALLQGLVQASAVISVLDAQSGLLSADKLKERSAKVSTNQLQHFKI